jgi:hypothetical protein
MPDRGTGAFAPNQHASALFSLPRLKRQVAFMLETRGLCLNDPKSGARFYRVGKHRYDWFWFGNTPVHAPRVQHFVRSATMRRISFEQ